MLTYSDYFITKNASNEYFAGANTDKGFFGEYCNLFSEDDLTKLYMIKGGSGTGKSTLISRCADVGRECGAVVTLLRCSSDPDSLDGAIIEKEGTRIAVTDATAPHTQDPLYAGACGEIVNCGEFWCTAALEKSRDYISHLIKEKEGAYKRAYRYLGAVREIFEASESLAKKYLLSDKMERAQAALCKSLGISDKKRRGKVIYRRTMGVSMKGAVRLSSFERAGRVIAVKDGVGLLPSYLESLLKLLVDLGETVAVSLSPVFGIGELWAQDCDVAFVPYREGIQYAKKVNLRRFADPVSLGDVKQRRFFAARCTASMMEGAEESLLEAGAHHFSLERIYRDAMDFEGLSRMGDALCSTISKRLS
ncbi:MAG: hypothetical protein IKL24_04160 [Clostridia bacterium]|nr:hypothetical protein [Clostridia bacterium]